MQHHTRQQGLQGAFAGGIDDMSPNNEVVMGVRGQNPEAWVARFRKGMCPIHGTGLTVLPSDTPVDVRHGEDVGCTNIDPAPCLVRARRYLGKDPYHHRFGLVTAPDAIRQALRKTNDIGDDGQPTRWTVNARTSYPLEDIG